MEYSWTTHAYLRDVIFDLQNKKAAYTSSYTYLERSHMEDNKNQDMDRKEKQRVITMMTAMIKFTPNTHENIQFDFQRA